MQLFKSGRDLWTPVEVLINSISRLFDSVRTWQELRKPDFCFGRFFMLMVITAMVLTVLPDYGGCRRCCDRDRWQEEGGKDIFYRWVGISTRQTYDMCLSEHGGPVVVTLPFYLKVVDLNLVVHLWMDINLWNFLGSLNKLLISDSNDTGNPNEGSGLCILLWSVFSAL